MKSLNEMVTELREAHAALTSAPTHPPPICELLDAPGCPHCAPVDAAYKRLEAAEESLLQRLLEPETPVELDRIRELQAGQTRLVEENRALRAELKALRDVIAVDQLGGSTTKRIDTRRADVTAFFGMAGQEVGATPHVPSDKVVRFRLGLIAEELSEVLGACLGKPAPGTDAWQFWNLLGSVAMTEYINTAPLAVDLPELAKELEDVDYVVEGARVAFGIDGVPLWNEVHRSNLEKQGGPKDPKTGKQLKPDGWTPPDIAALLRAQGWSP